jgi:pimeloyl-ACP methyl ester carboxylesterase
MTRLSGPAVLAAGAGLAMGALALANTARARAAERRNPPKGRFLTVDGVRLHFREAGPRDAQAVLLLHGNGATSEDFVASGLFGRLAAAYRVIALDRPGFGYSERPRRRAWTPAAQALLVADALGTLGAGRAVVVGHSWGAMVAAALCMHRPSILRGAVLASGYYFPTVRPEVPFFAVPAIPVLGDAVRYTLAPPLARAIAPRLIRRIFAPQAVPRRFSEGFPLDLALRPSQLRASAAESGLMVPAAAGLAERYSEIGVPLTIIAGTADRIVDYRQSVHLHECIPGSRLIELPGEGHMVHYFAPRAFLDAVEQFAAPRAAPAPIGSVERWTQREIVPTVPGIP